MTNAPSNDPYQFVFQVNGTDIGPSLALNVLSFDTRHEAGEEAHALVSVNAWDPKEFAPDEAVPQTFAHGAELWIGLGQSGTNVEVFRGRIANLTVRVGADSMHRVDVQCVGETVAAGPLKDSATTKLELGHALRSATMTHSEPIAPALAGGGAFAGHIGTLICHADPSVRVGADVSVTGLGEAFDGTFRAVGVRHRAVPGEVKTEIDVRAKS